MNPRHVAVKILYQVIVAKRPLDEPFTVYLQNYSDTQQLPFIKALCFGVLRYYPQLNCYCQSLLKKPLANKHQDLKILMLSGLYQLLSMDLPAYAAISETVAVTICLNKPWAKGLVNGILRNFQRSQKQIQQQFLADPTVKYLHPEWMIKLLSSAWPKHWESILTANNLYPPMSVRVNLQRLSRDAYLKRLQLEGIAARPSPGVASGIILSSPLVVESLPGFSQGEVSVQDLAAQLAAYLLQLKSGMRVLDACSAPGGKTCHILELAPNLGELVAVEKNATRLERVVENLERLNLSTSLIQADVGDPEAWWAGEKFDRILLDAPCSASGVIRRHPDIKLLRRLEDIEKYAAQQIQLLTKLWPLLKVQGLLLYATCSVFPAENETVIHRFLQQQPDATIDFMSADWGVGLEYGRQIFPGSQDMDGFYYARLVKK